MGVLRAFRILSRNSGQCFGSLRLNGLYLVSSHFATPSLQRTSQAIVSYQAKLLSTTSVTHAAPEIEQAGHDHVMHWTAERVLTVVLLGTIPAAILIPTPSLEYLLALTMTVHSHWGVEAVVVDYIRPNIFGKFIPKLAVGAVYGLSIMTLGGLCYFIYTDVGIINAVKMLWKL